MGGCGDDGSTDGECEFRKVKGIQSKKFKVPADLLNTKKDGVVTDSCRGSVSKKFASDYPGTTRQGPTCEKSMMDTRRYANLFSAETDNGDVFVWPFMYIKKEPAITASGARDFVKLIYGAYDAGFHLDAFGLVVFLSCAMLAGICGRTNTNKLLGRTVEETPQTDDMQRV